MLSDVCVPTDLIKPKSSDVARSVQNHFPVKGSNTPD